MTNYSLRELNILSRNLKYNRDTLEKVLRLSELLKLFNDHEELKGKYLLKGGTAINLCLFDFPRLSVDIDMDFNLELTKDEMESVRSIHKKLISDQVSINGYLIHSKSKFTYTLDSYLLQYTNAIGSNDYIKIELNYSNRVHILNPQNYHINSNVVGNTSILGMNKIELYGSKIAALIGRTTARDVFDVSEMIREKVIKEDEFDMLRKTTIFYLLLSSEFQTFESLISQFKNNIDNINQRTIKRNLIPMLRVGTMIDRDDLINRVVEFVNELLKLEDNEKEFINSYNLGEYKPNLLFDKLISQRLVNHPMAIWKMMNYNN